MLHEEGSNCAAWLTIRYDGIGPGGKHVGVLVTRLHKVRQQIGKGSRNLCAALGPRSTFYVEKSRILLDFFLVLLAKFLLVIHFSFENTVCVYGRVIICGRCKWLVALRQRGTS